MVRLSIFRCFARGGEPGCLLLPSEGWLVHLELVQVEVRPVPDGVGIVL